MQLTKSRKLVKGSNALFNQIQFRIFDFSGFPKHLLQLRHLVIAHKVAGNWSRVRHVAILLYLLYQIVFREKFVLCYIHIQYPTCGYGCTKQTMISYVYIFYSFKKDINIKTQNEYDETITFLSIKVTSMLLLLAKCSTKKAKNLYENYEIQTI